MCSQFDRSPFKNQREFSERLDIDQVRQIHHWEVELD